MDWLEFIASIVGSLAWPGVVLIFLWINRGHLANLLDWIEELTLPGGFKFKFTKSRLLHKRICLRPKGRTKRKIALILRSCRLLIIFLKQPLSRASWRS
jgi:hypothetical protein